MEKQDLINIYMISSRGNIWGKNIIDANLLDRFAI